MGGAGKCVKSVFSGENVMTHWVGLCGRDKEFSFDFSTLFSCKFCIYRLFLGTRKHPGMELVAQCCVFVQNLGIKNNI